MFKLNKGKFRWSIRKKPFTVKVMTHWNRLSRNVVMSCPRRLSGQGWTIPGQPVLAVHVHCSGTQWSSEVSSNSKSFMILRFYVFCERLLINLQDGKVKMQLTFL